MRNTQKWREEAQLGQLWSGWARDYSTAPFLFFTPKGCGIYLSSVGMNLKGFQLDTFLALVMALGSAAFLGLGRMLFDALGWYMLVTIPLSFVFAGGLYVLWKIPVCIDVEDSSGVSHKVFGWRESWAFIIVSEFLVLTGFLLVDFDDTDHGAENV